jgi:serine/threonine protein kinase
MTVNQETPKFLLAKYDSVQFIDRGVDGCVYKCVRNGTATAVKVLLDPLDTVVRARFAREVEILKRFNHPHIVRLLHAGETDGYHWLESEFADESHFGKMFPYLNYSNHERRDCFVQISLGVLALHESDPPIIHRDLKPRNILVFQRPNRESEPVLKVADFGLSAIAGDSSHLTTSGQVLGTGIYMAPERLQNPFLKTPESDIYSLGITFLEACTGGTTTGENIDNVPDVLRPIIRKMIRYSPKERYQSMREVIIDLNNLSMFQLIYGRDQEPGEVPGPSFSTNTAGQLARIVEVMYNATAENIENQVALFERTLDSLGSDIHDNKAHSISSIPSHVAKLIDQVLPDRLCRLVERFDYAAERTNEGDFFFDNPDQWGWFLGETFKVCSYRPTRYACLASLSKIFVRFETLWLRRHVGHLICSIEDPADLEHLAACLREQNRDDIAKLLDGAPEERKLDVQAIKLALRLVDGARGGTATE